MKCRTGDLTHERGMPACISQVMCGANLIMGYESEQTLAVVHVVQCMCILHNIIIVATLHNYYSTEELSFVMTAQACCLAVSFDAGNCPTS